MKNNVRNAKRLFSLLFLSLLTLGLITLTSFTKSLNIDRSANLAYIPGYMVYFGSDYAVPQDDQVYKEVKNPPVYPGGLEAMQKFIIGNIKYPSDCKKSGKQGTVYVGFIIDKSGKVKDVKARKPVHPSLDAEAERIVKAMPAWQPGSNAEGKAVKVEYTLPIKFALK